MGARPTGNGRTPRRQGAATVVRATVGQQLVHCYQVRLMMLEKMRKDLLAGLPELAQAVRDCPNAYLDLSYTLRAHARSSVWLDLKSIAHTLDRRLMFGSDFPEVGIGEAFALFTDLAAELEADKVDNILWNTSLKVLRRAGYG